MTNNNGYIREEKLEPMTQMHDHDCIYHIVPSSPWSFNDIYMAIDKLIGKKDLPNRS